MAWKTFDNYGRLLVSTNGASCAPVSILDQDNIIVQSVPSGGIYNVYVGNGIIDETPLVEPTVGIISNPFV